MSVLKDLSHDVFEAGDFLLSEVPQASLTVPLSLLVRGFPSSLAPHLQVIGSVAEACVSSFRQEQALGSTGQGADL